MFPLALAPPPEEFARAALKSLDVNVDDENAEQPAPHDHANPRGNGLRRGLGATAVGAGLLFAKFKSLLFVLLSFKWVFFGAKFALSFASILASVWVYAQIFTWKLAIAFVLLLIIHELGHWYAARSYGLPASLPMLIPGLGAFTTIGAPITDGVQSAVIGIAGPAAGGAAAGLLYVYGAATGNAFWFAAAHIGFLLNAFNLIPILPFDGGRIAGSISTRLWLVGLIAIVAFLALTGGFHSITTLILIALVAAFVPRAIAAWRGRAQPMFPGLTPRARGAIALAYFALFVLLGIATYATSART